MFALPFLGLGQPMANLRVGDPGEAPTGLQRLLELFQTGEEGFTADLQALLLQMTPQTLQRLEAMLAGGMSLPLAASRLLAEAGETLPPAGLAPRGTPLLVGEMAGGDVEKTGLREPEDARLRLRDGLPGAVTPSAAAPTTVPRIVLDLPVIGAPVGSPGHAAAAATTAPAPLVSPNPGLPQQLATSLLEMGVPQPVGSRGWDGAIAERVMWMAQGDQQFARLSLNPPHLGPLEIRVSLNQDQTSVTFLAHQAPVREALEAAMPRLRELFDQQSLSLVHAEVADPGSQRDPRSGESAAGEARHAIGGAAGLAADDADDPLELPVVNARGLVDLFA
jgi:flagellar hook-length control protein FliK